MFHDEKCFDYYNHNESLLFEFFSMFRCFISIIFLNIFRPLHRRFREKSSMLMLIENKLKYINI